MEKPFLLQFKLQDSFFPLINTTVQIAAAVIYLHRKPDHAAVV